MDALTTAAALDRLYVLIRNLANPKRYRDRLADALEAHEIVRDLRRQLAPCETQKEGTPLCEESPRVS